MQRYDRVRMSHALMDCQTVRAQAACTGAQWGGGPGEGGQEQVQEGLCGSICPCLAVHVLIFLARLEGGWREARLTNCCLGIRQDALPRVDTQQRRVGVCWDAQVWHSLSVSQEQKRLLKYKSAPDVQCVTIQPAPEKLASCLPLVLNPLSRWHTLLPAQVSWKGGHFQRQEAELPSQGSADLPDRGRKSSFRRKNFPTLELAPQARQTPAFQGCWFAFLRARVFQRQACGIKKKKIMFNLKIRNWSRLWAQGLIETKFKFLSSPFKHGGPS